MKVLILSCNTGEGHNSVAKAPSRNSSMRIASSVRLWILYPLVSRAELHHQQRARVRLPAPALCGKVYRFEETHSKADRKFLTDLQGKRQFRREALCVHSGEPVRHHYLRPRLPGGCRHGD